ncbi:MAG: radical SAM protein [Oscillospiraceae bacterium]
MIFSMENCTLCPRNCGVDRTKSLGFCGVGDKIKVARAMLHKWEEPVISGKNGSGTVFFSGCNLKCCFCQNAKISKECVGKELSINELADLFLQLQDMGAENINLVTAGHYLLQIINALDIAKPKLHIPIVYNTGSYEKVEAIKMLDGYIDIYLPDLKYVNSQMSNKYSNAPDYFEVAINAIKEMKRQVGKNVFDEQGMMKNGIIIRHLIMPMGYKDSIEVLTSIADEFPLDEILVSIMSQYTPQGESKYKELNRKIYTIEYEKVIAKANELKIKGFMQERTSAKSDFTPEFSDKEILF